jgi:hypothetical protein
MNTTNGISGNALSDQPLEVQKAIKAQLAAGTLAPTTQPAVQTKQFDPQVIQLLGGLFTQLLGAFGQRVPAGKDFDPAVLSTFANLLSQLLGAVIPKAQAASKGEMKRDYILNSGDFEWFPTWSFWGETKVRMVNVGQIPVVVLINDDRFQLEPGQATSKGGKWAAFPIKVTNATESVGSMVQITVT